MRCSYGGCASVTPDGKGGLVVIGKIAAGLATQMTRADGRLLSETIAADETAVLIGEEYFSELPALVALREELEREKKLHRLANTMRFQQEDRDSEELARLRSENERLREALDQMLDDMGDDGLCVCPAAKAQGIAALSATAASQVEETT